MSVTSATKMRPHLAHLHLESTGGQERVSSAVGVLLGAKLIADMFPSVGALDYAALGFALVLFAASLKTLASVRLGLIDCVAVFILLLIGVNACFDLAGVYIAVKMASALLLYFIGRSVIRDLTALMRLLWGACLVVLAANAATFVSGSGFQIWGGGANTLSGMYYFKTDLANAMCFVVVMALFYSEPGRTLRVIVVILGSVFVLLSNARAYYFVLPCVFLLRWLMHKKVRVGFRHVAILASVMVAMIFVLRFLGTTAFFESMNFISFRFDSLSDLLNGSNTQGRDYLFAAQMGRVFDSSLVRQLFGNGFTGDLVLMNGRIYGAHSLYVGTIFNLGYIGMVLLLVFLAKCLLYARSLQDFETGYLFISLCFVFLVSGLSFDVFQYTANSWNVFFFAGCVVSLGMKGSLRQDASFSGLADCPGRSNAKGFSIQRSFQG